MKNALTLSIVAFLLISFSACTKCYQCTNHCSVCRQQHPDTTFTIQVCSNVLSEQYYVEYIDSLNSLALAWHCTDTASTYSEKFCDTKSKNNGDIINKTNAGLGCTAD